MANGLANSFESGSNCSTLWPPCGHIGLTAGIGSAIAGKEMVFKLEISSRDNTRTSPIVKLSLTLLPMLNKLFLCTLNTPLILHHPPHAGCAPSVPP